MNDRNEQKDSGLSGMVHRAEDTVGGMVGKASAKAAGSSPTMFVENAGVSDLYEIEAGRIATSKSNSPEIRQMAEKMVADHTNSMQLLSKAAAAENGQLTVPASLDSRRQGMIDHLNQAGSDDFDEVYLSQQKMAHEEAITLFESFSSKENELGAHARATLPILRGHNEMVNRFIGT